MCDGKGNTYAKRSWLAIIIIVVIVAVLVLAILFMRWISRARTNKSKLASENYKETARVYSELLQGISGRYIPVPMQGFTDSVRY